MSIFCFRFVTSIHAFADAVLAVCEVANFSDPPSVDFELDGAGKAFSGTGVFWAGPCLLFAFALLKISSILRVLLYVI